MEPPLPPLSPDEQETYSWQISVPGFGEAGQAQLKAASVLVTRVGGLGGVVAYELAAAGIGRLILAHAGVTKRSDLNRQLLMTHANLGQSRVECARRRLLDLNPRLEVVAVPENVSSANAAALVGQADIVVDCAPRFEERHALNQAAVRQGKPMVECAMYDLEAQITTLIPGQTPCLACLFPDRPPAWTRRFPVFGAVSGTVGCLAALEVIKLLSGVSPPVLNRLLYLDLRTLRIRSVPIARRPDCPVCSPCRPEEVG